MVCMSVSVSVRDVVVWVVVVCGGVVRAEYRGSRRFLK